MVTTAPSLSQALVRCLLLEPGGSRGDGLVWSLVDGLHDTAAPVLAGPRTGNREMCRRAPVSDRPGVGLVATGLSLSVRICCRLRCLPRRCVEGIEAFVDLLLEAVASGGAGLPNAIKTWREGR
jgi:hypothetical protein